MKVIVYDLDATEDEEYERLYYSIKEAREDIAWERGWQRFLEQPVRTYVIEKYEESD